MSGLFFSDASFWSSLGLQLLNGWAGASSLFLVAAGLSLIFGVTRIVNLAHGAFFMLGLYLAYSVSAGLSAALMTGGLGAVLASGLGFWLGLLLTGLMMAALGALVEVTILRRLYAAPALLQLLATFALVLLIKDAVLWFWGPEDLLGPRAPGLSHSIEWWGGRVPTYNLFLLAMGPAVLVALEGLLNRTRWGSRVRAATQDRAMLSALGQDPAGLFTSVFALGSGLAGLAGALQLPLEPAHLDLDLSTLTAAFVVVVVGGLGSIRGAYAAALLIGLANSLCIWLGTQTVFGVVVSFSKLTLVMEFLIMAGVLVFRPYGLMGHALASVVPPSSPNPFMPTSMAVKTACGQNLSAHSRLAKRWGLWALWGVVLTLLSLPLWVAPESYVWVMAIDVLIAILFILGLSWMMGTGGMDSFGHAAYFGMGAYATALLCLSGTVPLGLALIGGPLLAGILALIFGALCVRLSGVYLAMLSLALAQVIWGIAFEWDSVTGGSNGLNGVSAPVWLQSRPPFYEVVLMLALVATAGLWRLNQVPFGLTLRASRDAPVRAEALGISVHQIRWLAWALAGSLAGLAGSLFVWAKGGVSPEVMSLHQSLNGLVMVVLGGVGGVGALVNALSPWSGALVFNELQVELARYTDYWHAAMGLVLLALVLALPQGILGIFSKWRPKVQGLFRQARA